MAPLGDYSIFSEKLARLKILVPEIPQSVPLGKKSDRIHQVFLSIPHPEEGSEHHEVFNRRMDALFGEDTRDATTGRLPNVTRGPFGMDLVVKYLVTATEAGFLVWDIASIKLDRLISEIEALKKAAPATSVSRKTSAKKPAQVEEESEGYDSDKDPDYVPPKKVRPEPESPSRVYDSDCAEIVETTEKGAALEERRKEKKAKKDAEKKSKDTSEPPKKKKKNTRKKSSKGTVDEPVEIESGDESDGQSALQTVVAAAAKPSGNARRGPANMSMQSFTEPIAVSDAHGQLRWEFRCKRCSCVRTFKRTLVGDDISFDSEPLMPKLNNLATHHAECLKKNPDPSPDDSELPHESSANFNLEQTREFLAGYLEKGRLNPAVAVTKRGFLRLFVAWILDECLPWTTGESPTLRLLFEYLKITYALPSDTTVKSWLAKIYDELHGKLVIELTNQKSKISYGTDTWTVKQMTYSFACSTASFIDDNWELICRVIDFKPLEDKEHGGVLGGLAFVNGAQKRGGLDKITLTCDNASVNDKIVETASRCLLARYGIPESDNMHIRCMAHVINLVVQAFLAGMDESKDPDDDDNYDTAKAFPLYFNPDEEVSEVDDGPDSEENGHKLSEDEELEMAEAITSSSPLKRLRYLAIKIVSSPQRRIRFRKIATEKYGLNPETAYLALLMVIRDVVTRWNSTYAMIKRALLLRDAIDAWVFETESLRGLGLSKSDWKLLEQLMHCLEPFTQATLQLSHENQATLPFALPLYLKLDIHLRAIVSNRATIDIKIRHGAEAALAKLLKYRGYADENQYYKVATALHPSLRSRWFRKLGQSETEKNHLVSQVEDLVQLIGETYAPKYALSQPPPTSSSPNGASPENNATTAYLNDVCAIDMPSASPAVSIKTPLQMLEDEVDRYFTKFEGGLGQLDKPLQWWKTHAPAFPILAQMARDFLAISATSVPVERVFSKSRHICQDLRSSLKADTISKTLLTKVWISSGLFDVNEPVQKKRKHGEIS